MNVPVERIPNDYEKRIVDFARRALDDDPDCRNADYAVRWVEGRPVLVLAFHLPQTAHQPALGIALVTVRKGTMLETFPGTLLLEGDRLRDHILRSADAYLTQHGVKIATIDHV